MLRCSYSRMPSDYRSRCGTRKWRPFRERSGCFGTITAATAGRRYRPAGIGSRTSAAICCACSTASSSSEWRFAGCPSEGWLASGSPRMRRSASTAWSSAPRPRACSGPTNMPAGRSSSARREWTRSPTGLSVAGSHRHSSRAGRMSSPVSKLCCWRRRPKVTPPRARRWRRWTSATICRGSLRQRS